MKYIGIIPTIALLLITSIVNGQEKMQTGNSYSSFICFTADRMNDIHPNQTSLPDSLLQKSVDERVSFKGVCAPGEFYSWQIGVYAAFSPLNNLSIQVSDFVSNNGKRIKSSAIRCFNLGGVDENGHLFAKVLNVEKGRIQPLWMGIDIPTDANGTYKGSVIVCSGLKKVITKAEIVVAGTPIENHGFNDGWRKTRLAWLDSRIGQGSEPTAPYIPLTVHGKFILYLGGTFEISQSGLPAQITLHYDQTNRLDKQVKNNLLAGKMIFEVETQNGNEEFHAGKVKFVEQSSGRASWNNILKSRHFEMTCVGSFGFDGFADYQISLKALTDIKVQDIHLEVPYSKSASRYMMGLGHKGGFRPDSLVEWHWNVDYHQDQIWMGNVNGGMNFCFMDEKYVRPLVNVYYHYGKLLMPTSWGNGGKGGITVSPNSINEVCLTAFSGERTMKAGETLHFNFHLLITPVKPIMLDKMATERIYHSTTELSSEYVAEAKKAGANMITIHHRKDIYPFINYPYYDKSVPDFRQFIQKANTDGLKVRVYYTTRELTVKLPELWALRSLGNEVIHDGPGPKTRTVLHPNGPDNWLNENLVDHFIPAWFNPITKGKFAGETDISVITTPDSRWNNYYLEGLDWMIRNMGISGMYIDDSALDRQTLQRARRILDSDGNRRVIDLHSWNHFNKSAGFANSIQLYCELLPYIDRTWLGEGFRDANTPDFWLVEMSGIPFGLMSEMLDAKNEFRGMTFGMLPRIPWSGDPVPLFHLWDSFGMKDAAMHGFWEDNSPITIDNSNIRATVYTNGDKAMLVIANWTDLPQKGNISISEQRLGFKPSSYIVPEIRNLQWGKTLSDLKNCEIMGRSGLIVLLSK